MDKPHKAVLSALLPQYQWSEAFIQRFLEAIHFDGAEIKRSPNVRGLKKKTDKDEISRDALAYFTDQKSAMEKEFHAGLAEGLGRAKADWFCDAVAVGWYRCRLTSKRVRQLKSSVNRYLRLVDKHVSISNSGAVNLVPDSEPLPLSATDISKILTLNDQMLVKHIEAWKETHPNYDRISSDDIFIRRGLYIENLFDPTRPYSEWDYINSYSLAFSAPEKFTQIGKGTIPALVNGDVHMFDGRVLFFSPFVPGMDECQLEAGIIPGRPQPITYQGEHGAIHEYILGDGPWRDD